MPRGLRGLLQFWWTLADPVDRRTYCLTGFALAFVKYLGDIALIKLGNGRFWKPTDYLQPTHSLLWTTFQGAPSWLVPALIVWMLPFLWIGVNLTLRRTLDAGLSPWLTLLFFVPYVNYVIMAVLCFAPTAKHDARPKEPIELSWRRLPSAFVSISAGVGLGIALVALGSFFGTNYGISLFLGCPFAMGALTAFLFNCRYPATAFETMYVTIFMFVFVAGALLLLAFEGILCIAIAVPVALAVGLLGAALGRAIALRGRRNLTPAVSAMLLLPIFAALEPPKITGQVLHEVQSSVVIDAPPQRVWEHVISFQPIPEPSDFIFRAGIAYPRYARIEGAGVGAVRYCVFSTGAFVEPITRWEPGARLGFDVSSSPDPLRELTIYANVSPPHLHGYLRSRRGEFRLIALPGNRTRLEGSTWYEIEMAPEGYWQLWSDYLIHRIHYRVLDHIKHEAEAAQ
jgi:uncharacterized membrane protein YhaH (DUF805 family)